MNGHLLPIQPTSTLFDDTGYSLVDRYIQDILIIVFKAINNYLHRNF